MKVKFLSDQFIECWFVVPEYEDPMMEVEKVLQGEVFDIDILDDDVRDEIIQIEFENGSVSFIDRKWIKIEE
jgi:frataxin-like iron-binding protein CyaY